MDMQKMRNDIFEFKDGSRRLFFIQMKAYQGHRYSAPQKLCMGQSNDQQCER